MAQVILKKSSVSLKVPLVTDLTFGEVALNYLDGRLYYKKADGGTISYFPDISNVTYIGTTSISLSRTSAVQTLTGVNIDGTAAIATTATTANALNSANSYTVTGLTINSTGVIALQSSGDIVLYRQGGTTGAIYFTGSTNNRYLFYDGTDFRFAAAGDLYINNVKVLIFCILYINFEKSFFSNFKCFYLFHQWIFYFLMKNISFCFYFDLFWLV